MIEHAEVCGSIDREFWIIFTTAVTRMNQTAQKFWMGGKTTKEPSQCQRSKENKDKEDFIQGEATGTTKKSNKSKGGGGVQLVVSA